MQKENISAEITERAFDFFYWFSRFEFSLKENGYLKHIRPGDRAEPGWDNFVQKHSDKYSISQSATALIEQRPEQQIVLPGRELGWRPVKLDDHNSDLARVAHLLKTVRNNLFHGGKHGGANWDNPERTIHLILLSKAILDEFAALGDFEADYKRIY
ncbi:hypothetical protein ACIUZJ_27080 [Pseudomonas aeruginosa]|uniref:hypothetical protein n=1 Tax=Pseudomonas aeruginosa TaxID=287 RepID=UPI000941556C|nr:hypothetical protein [Pseudomonas aeruginosa]OKR44615.1 hypothetical protein BH595_17390 [Pseudomonas aeruginosa]RMK21320.1 hypothetical protein IPC95_29795 [Pseudomonas aeruginosa]HBO4889760.1 hypothetical protein [Pseudomonas aeruginosa]HBO4890131.1 hypothetical protein [Pseudomonas aeruginosa]HBP6002636.1 hypothetical protein [Pseudomonas aeruginosa]